MKYALRKSGQPCFVIGLMSGTSADGIDAVVAAITNRGTQLQASIAAHVHRPFRNALRERILKVCLEGRVAEICELNFELGEHFAKAALAAVRQAGLQARDIRAIGSHGQTIHHLPNARTPSTLQIGEPAVIAERTDITTIADFRVRDMAAGGQGAPLVPFADWTLFTHASRPRIVQNIGGIGNLTFLPARATIDQVTALDTGPGNMVIDAVVTKLSHGHKTFDRDGQWAAEGNICRDLLDQLMTHRFLKRRPPKTTGREEFGATFVAGLMAGAKRHRLRPADIVATVTAFTAASIADAYRRFVFPRLSRRQKASLQVILGGGGAKNPVLRRMLAERLNDIEICTLEDFGIANAAKEALAFAILAHQTLLGRPGNVQGATGATRPVVLGKIIPRC